MGQTKWLTGIVAAAIIGAGCSLGEQTDSDSPIVGIISPKADSVVSGVVTFSAQVVDGFGVAKVEFMVDGAVISEDLSSPYSATWNTRGGGDGPHALRVQATDLAGNVGFASIGVTVDNTRQ